jgi:hypothetical protein
MIKQITIREIYRNEGLTKSGSKYVMAKLLATDRCYYVTFKPSSIAHLTKGMQVSLECTEAGQGKFDIIKIISPTPDAYKDTSRSAEGPDSKIPTSLSIIPPDEAGASARVEARLKKAFEIVDRAYPKAREYADYLAMVLEEARQLQQEAQFKLERDRLVQSDRWLELEKKKAKS